MKELNFLEVDILKNVQVRLLEEGERERFDELIEQKHYLASAEIVGRTLRYVAEVNGQWVALLCFSTPSLHLKQREKWIGWTPRRRARRLGFVVNNSRYLVLLERERVPNLASRVLGLTLKRLSSDWEAAWGQPVLVVESFVDENRYRGVCYRACGFEAVGLTEGYGRCAGEYFEKHGQPKQLYLKELRVGDRALLCRARLPDWLEQHENRISGPCPFKGPALGSLFQRFRSLEDKRRGHGLRHTQSYVLACASIAIMMGAGGYQSIEDVCRKFTTRQLQALGCWQNRKGKYEAPSDSTFLRVLRNIDVQVFDRIIGQWLLEQEISTIEQVAIDGKTLRGSGRTDGKPLQLLSVVTHRMRLTLGQIAIEDKSNEIPALPKLIRQLPACDKMLVTADAMHCQQEGSRVITQERGWDYLWGLKGNQSGILERAQSLTSSRAFPP